MSKSNSLIHFSASAVRDSSKIDPSSVGDLKDRLKLTGLTSDSFMVD